MQASILRQIVAGPRLKHPEANLDLCYVTDQIIATSGPSATYPQRAYRNPLDSLVKFLDSKHDSNWAIWEFRAEGTGYPDSEVHGRIWHYPWPDHHPPPFALIPGMMGSMRNWLKGGDGRIVVVHCKAGKGRSGTASVSYLISECGWSPTDALERFTARRMRPGFGAGVSIPSQLRWIDYVTLWTTHQKIYVERAVEILELHVWGLRDGVKVAIEGYVDQGKVIKTFHVFKKSERYVVDGTKVEEDPRDDGKRETPVSAISAIAEAVSAKENNLTSPTQSSKKTAEEALATSRSSALQTEADKEAPSQAGTEVGGNAVIFRPKTRVVLPTNDVNIDFERRNKAGYGWTMVTAVAHVWFNAYFEGLIAAEKSGSKTPAEDGVFEIEWDAMDGIKGSLRKGTRALDRLKVVWRVYDPSGDGAGKKEEIIKEPAVGEEISGVEPADWRGAAAVSERQGMLGKDLGLRTESPVSAEVSKASSVVDLSRDTGEPVEDDEGVKGDLEDEDAALDKLPQPTADAPVPDLKDLQEGLDTASHTTPAVTEGEKPLPEKKGSAPAGDGNSEGVVLGQRNISTASLPGGVAEEDMKNSEEHMLGQMHRKRDASSN